MTVLVGVLLGVLGMGLVVVVTAAVAEHRSPTFPDAPCIPVGACERHDRCAMHDTVFQHISKPRAEGMHHE